MSSAGRRWGEVEALYHDVLERPVEDRDRFLADACGEDRELLEEVASLLRFEERGEGLLREGAAPPSPAPAPALSPGARLGAYEIEELVGAGGMGEVYRARDTRLGREVAVKVLPADFTGSPERRERFEREARAISRLSHPHICSLHDVGREGDADFLVMEYLVGESLVDRLARGPLALGEVLEIGGQIADALETAHRHGVVHRDLKPGNVLLTRSGAKLLDFSLARLLPPVGFVDPSEDGAVAGPTADPTTRPGTFLGTLHYMAPEQIEGRPADTRADVFAFGCLLFEMITGRRAFGGDNPAGVVAAILRGDAPDLRRELGESGDGLPSGLQAVVDRCLAKDPDARWQSIADVGMVLRDVVEGDGVDDARDTPRAMAGPWRRLAPGFALAALALVPVAWLLGRGVSPEAADPGPEVRFTIGAPDGGPLTDLGDVVISPDGRWVVYSGGAQESEGLVVGGDLAEAPLRVRAVDSFDGETRVLTGTEGALYPFFSPDSAWVGFFRGGGGVRTLFRADLRGGSVLPISTRPRPGYQADWGEDGRLVLGFQRGGLSRVDVDTGTAGEAFTQLDQAHGEVAHVNPEILPGGRGIVFTGLGGATSDPRVRVWDARSGETRTLLARGTRARYVEPGRLLYALEGNLLMVGFDLEELAVVGEPRIVVRGVATERLGRASFDVSRDGTLVYLPGVPEPPRVYALVWVGTDGAVEQELVRGDVQHPQISVDGRSWLARTSNSELALFEAGAPAPRRFSTRIPLAAPPLLTEDGAAVYGNPSLSAGARLFRLDLANGVSTPIGGPADERLLPVALDRQRQEVIALVVRRAEDGALLSHLVAGDLQNSSPPRELVTGPALVTGARLSPDGDRIAYSVLTDSVTLASTLYVADYPERSRRVAISESMTDNAFAWGTDGRLWFVDGTDDGMRSVRFAEGADLQVASVERAFGLPESIRAQRGFALAADGRLLMVRGEGETSRRTGRLHVIVGWAAASGAADGRGR